MSKVLVFYYSRTGNTGVMAKAVAEGAKAVAGVKVELNYYVPLEALASFDALVFGAPTYHHDIPLSVKNFLEDVAVKNVDLRGKLGAAFGSYGWSGEAPRLVLEILKNRFGMVVVEPPLLIKYAPDKSGLEACMAFGRRVAERLMHTT